MYFEYECPNGCPKYSVVGNVDVNRDCYCTYCGSLMELKKVYESLDAKIKGELEAQAEKEAEEKEESEPKAVFQEEIAEPKEEILEKPEETIEEPQEEQKPIEPLKIELSETELAEFPELRNAKLEIGFGIELRPHNPKCVEKGYFCITKGDKNLCLKLLHKKPEGNLKEMFEILKCQLESESKVEETQTQEIEEVT